jgi:hypothetical protein
MLRTGVVITDGNNLHAEPGGKKVVHQLARTTVSGCLRRSSTERNG